MNAFRIVPFSLLMLLPMRLPAEVQVGDPAGDVYSELGSPRGKAMVGERELLYYERGEVELKGGVVTRVAFLSDEDFATREANRLASQERMAASNAEGEAIKAQRLTDLSFQKAPATVQLAFWQDFARKYPGVSVAEQMALVRNLVRVQTEQERIRSEEERYLAEAEARRANEPAVYGVDPSYYGGGYGYGGYGRGSGYGRRNNRGSSDPILDPIRPPYDRSVGPYSYARQAVVEPFSPTPIVTPFLPSPPPQVNYPWANLPPAGGYRGSDDRGSSGWRDRR